MEKKIIRLWRVNGNWYADFEHDVEIMQLFGTTLIVTAFRGIVDKETVIRELQKLNPNCEVVSGEKNNEKRNNV